MAANFHIQYCLDDAERKKITKNKCVKFFIHWFDTTFMKKQFSTVSIADACLVVLVSIHTNKRSHWNQNRSVSWRPTFNQQRETHGLHQRRIRVPSQDWGDEGSWRCHKSEGASSVHISTPPNTKSGLAIVSSRDPPDDLSRPRPPPIHEYNHPPDDD